MQPRFYIEREKEQDIFYKEYVNGTGYFGFHSPIELYLVDEGQMEVIINDKKKNLTKNQMSVALSFDAHSYRTLENSKSSVLIIPTYMCEEFVSTIKHKRILNPFICDEEAVLRIKELICQWNKKGINHIEKQGYIYLILGIVYKCLNFENSSEPIDPELSSKLLFYINENFKKDLTLASVAAEFGYNQSYISRYFKASFNTGLSRYITMVRLKNALILMHEKKHTLTYCALESGFNSMRTFYRVFAEEFKCSPKEYITRMS
jgi:AraC-like DNA-binding protein